MIDDSVPWRRGLLKAAASLERRRSQRRWLASTHYLIERELFQAPYGMRKLIESRKVSEEVEGGTWPVRTFGAPRGVVDIMNRQEIDVLYDLSHFTTERIALVDICNQFIHSFVFMLSCAEGGGLDGIFVASDRVRNRRLFWFDVADVVGMLRAVAEDDIVTIHMERAQVGSELEITRKSNGTR